MADGPKDYQIGYGKPPKNSRFRKGRSGNPKGRPNGARSLKTDLATELGKRIDVREGERRHRVSKQEALIKRLIEKGLSGDPRAMTAIFNLMIRAFGLDEGETHASELPADDQEILAVFRQQIIQTATVESPEPDNHDSTLSDDEIIDAEDVDESGQGEGDS
jgi:hypothetical protein